MHVCLFCLGLTVFDQEAQGVRRLKSLLPKEQKDYPASKRQVNMCTLLTRSQIALLDVHDPVAAVPYNRLAEENRPVH